MTPEFSEDLVAAASGARRCQMFRDAAGLAEAGGPEPGRVRAFAVGAGLTGAGLTGAGLTGAGATFGETDEDVLRRWLAGTRAVLEAETAEGEDGGALLLVLSVLGVLKAADRDPLPGTLPDIPWEAVRLALQDLCDHTSSRFPFRTRRRYADARWGNQLPGLMELLAGLGMVRDGAWTDLGRWASTTLPGALPLPAGPALSPAALVEAVSRFSEDHVRHHVASDWLEGRDPAAAARELLTAAGTMAPGGRAVAVWIAQSAGAGALPAWREAADAAYAGPYARMMLRQEGELPGSADADRRWLAVEKAAVVLEDDDPDEALTALWESLPGEDLDAVLAAVPATGHPDADAVAKQVAAFVASGAPRSVEQALQLKVALRGHPVWRRVQVPAIFTLADLHDVVQDLFGWDSGGAYVFGVRNNAYSGGARHLGATGYDDEFRVGAALAVAKKITYTYDQGASWEHEITLEKRLPQDPERSYPWCVASEGGNPVPVSGGSETCSR